MPLDHWWAKPIQCLPSVSTTDWLCRRTVGQLSLITLGGVVTLGVIVLGLVWYAQTVLRSIRLWMCPSCGRQEPHLPGTKTVRCVCGKALHG